MFKFALGVACGIFFTLCFIAYGPVGSIKSFREASKSAQDGATRTMWKICQRKVLDETHCYQDPKKTSKECDALISERCD